MATSKKKKRREKEGSKGQSVLKMKMCKSQLSMNCGIIANVDIPSLGRPTTQGLNHILRKAKTGKKSSTPCTKRMTIKKSKESSIKPGTIEKRTVFTDE